MGAMVIRFAVLDLNHQRPAERQRARNWLLQADDALSFWAAVCGTSVTEVRACAGCSRMTGETRALLAELRRLRVRFDGPAPTIASEPERQFCLDVDRDQPIARERPVTSLFHRFARAMASWWGWGRMRISLASRSWLNSRKVGVPSTSHNSQRHSSTTQTMSSACVDDSGIRGCSGTVSPSRWFGLISLSDAWVSRLTARDTPSTSTRGRREFRARMRLALSGRQGSGCLAKDPSPGARHGCASGDLSCAGDPLSPSATGASAALGRPGDEHSIVTALAVVQVAILSAADPLQAGQRAATIAWRIRDEQRIAPAASAPIDPPTIRRHASVRSPKEVDRPLAIHWDADGELSTVCAVRFPQKSALSVGACIVSLVWARRLSSASHTAAGFAQGARHDAARSRAHALAANQSEKGSGSASRSRIAYLVPEYTELPSSPENRWPANPPTV